MNFARALPMIEAHANQLSISIASTPSRHAPILGNRRDGSPSSRTPRETTWSVRFGGRAGMLLQTIGGYRPRLSLGGT